MADDEHMHHCWQIGELQSNSPGHQRGLMSLLMNLGNSILFDAGTVAWTCGSLFPVDDLRWLNRNQSSYDQHHWRHRAIRDRWRKAQVQLRKCLGQYKPFCQDCPSQHGCRSYFHPDTWNRWLLKRPSSVLSVAIIVAIVTSRTSEGSYTLREKQESMRKKALKA